MKKEINIPALRFGRFSGEWDKKKLKDILDVRSGQDYKHLKPGPVPVYGTGGFMLSVNQALSKDEDAIGIGRKGTIDKPYILRAPFWTVDTLFYTIPHKGFDLDFIYGIFQLVDWKALDESTGVPSLSKNAIGDVEAYFPSEKEQQEIGTFFAQIDENISLSEQKIKKLEQFRQAMLTKLFPAEGASEPALRFRGFSGPWVKRGLLENFTKIIDFRGRTPKKLGMDWSANGYPALSALNVKDGYIDFSQDVHFGSPELYEKWMVGNELHRGQVIFTTEAPMGNVAQIPDERKYILSQRTIAFEVYPALLTEDFLATLLRSPKVQKDLQALSSGGTAKGVSQRSMEMVDVVLPANIEEQKKIGDFFHRLDLYISLQKEKLKKMRLLKAALLDKLFV